MSGHSIPATTHAPATRALHAGRIPDPLTGALVTPIVQSTTYVQDHVGQTGTYAYSRVSNPTVSALESRLGALEDAPPAVSFASGLAAETTLFFSLLKSGDHVVLGEAIYGGTVRLIQQVFSNFGVTATFVDTSDAEKVRRAITPHTRLVFIESPANPTLRLTDIEAIAKITRAARIPLAVDNTFLTPILQRPLDLGADISVYATTKHIEGQSAALGGALIARDTALLDKFRFNRKCVGNIQAPFPAWLTERGINTLPLRIKQQSQNALEFAERLRRLDHVTAVSYPGLIDFPQRELAARQHLGHHGGIVAFELAGGKDAAIRALNNVELCSLVEHMGSVETLVTHPATMTHADVPPDHRRRVGISDGLIRVSVGLEDPADILADLHRAIAIAHEPAAIIERSPACPAIA